MDILEPQPSFIFWWAKFIPADPMNFFLIPFLSLPIFHQDWVNTIAHYPVTLESMGNNVSGGTYKEGVGGGV